MNKLVAMFINAPSPLHNAAHSFLIEGSKEIFEIFINLRIASRILRVAYAKF